MERTSANKQICLDKGVTSFRQKGKYISFLDADDYWSENKLKDQIFFMEKSNQVFTYTNYTTFIIKNNKKFFKNEIISPNSFNFDQFVKNTSIGMSSMIIKRSILEVIRFPKVKICEDYYFKCQLLRKNIAIKFNKNTMFYQISNNSLQSSNLRNFYWVWFINKNYNKFSFFKNLKSLFFITVNSIKKYGIK